MNFKKVKYKCAIGAIGTVLQGLEKRMEELKTRRKIKTLQITALLKLNRILKRVLEIEETPGKDLQSILVWKTHKEVK